MNNAFFPFYVSTVVILQAIVYSVLLLFVHPRPGPRTMSLVETVCLWLGGCLLNRN